MTHLFAEYSVKYGYMDPYEVFQHNTTPISKYFAGRTVFRRILSAFHVKHIPRPPEERGLRIHWNYLLESC